MEAGGRRTRLDFARCTRTLVDEMRPDAERVRLALEDLDTHEVASLYEAFPPEGARRIARRLDIHHTPEHGSRPNAAEMEFAALARQCLDRRLDSMEEPVRKLAAWQEARNRQKARVRWTFDVPAAREKLRHVYPSDLS